MTLRVAPELEEKLRTRVAEILHGKPEISYLEVVGDAALQEGGCRLETEAGIVDASLDTQIAALEKRLAARSETDEPGRAQTMFANRSGTAVCQDRAKTRQGAPSALWQLQDEIRKRPSPPPSRPA